MKARARVYAKSIGIGGTIIGEDINNTSSPRLENEKVWLVKWDNGKTGGGWRSGELSLIRGGVA